LWYWFTKYAVTSITENLPGTEILATRAALEDGNLSGPSAGVTAFIFRQDLCRFITDCARNEISGDHPIWADPGGSPAMSIHPRYQLEAESAGSTVDTD